jgi:hypothetical protein
LKLILEMPIKSARIRPTCMHCERIGIKRQSVERTQVRHCARARREDCTWNCRQSAQPSALSPQH